MPLSFRPSSSHYNCSSFDANNYVTSTTVNNASNTFTYDLAGNVTQDLINNYVYDPEGRLCAVQNLLTGTAHAQFRQYSSTQGRWMRPDPYYGSYDLANPQSFNRYAYDDNSPLAFVDPLGLDNTETSDPGDTDLCQTIWVDGSDYGIGTDPAPCWSGYYESFSGGVGGGEGGGGGNEGGDGLADNPMAQALFHSSQGQKAWNSGAWAVSLQGMGTWYGASLLGASAIVAAPAAGTAVNEWFLRPGEGRIFHAGWSDTQDVIGAFIEENGGRVITNTRLGSSLVNTVGFTSRFSPAAWAVASYFWASGATGQVTAFLSSPPSYSSYFYTIEGPILSGSPNVWSILYY